MSEIGDELADQTVGCRVQFKPWLGNSKRLKSEVAAPAIDMLGASAEMLTLTKKLLNPKVQQYKHLTQLKGLIIKYWETVSLPHPEQSVRLIRRDFADEFSAQMELYKSQLDEGVAALDAIYTDLVDNARVELGDAFDPKDYPPSLAGCFAIVWDFPSFEIPEYLAALAPATYARESARVAAMFDSAAAMAESAFLSDLGQLVDHMVERLEGGEDGKPKRFNESTITNMHEFFDRFSKLSIRSSQELDNIIVMAKSAMDGVSAGELRSSAEMRQDVSASMAQVQEKISDEMINRAPRKMVVPDVA